MTPVPGALAGRIEALGHGLLARAELIRDAEARFAPGLLSVQDEVDLVQMSAQLEALLRDWWDVEPPRVGRAAL